jgi:uncharacterized protein
MKKIFFALAALTFATVFHTSAFADFNDGVAAYRARNYAQAYKQLAPIASQGNREAQHFVGLMYYAGQGIPQDYKQAMSWFKKAAEQGHADAQYTLGGMAYTGKGMRQDYAQAVSWFRKAAEQGHAEAQYLLGLMYLHHAGGMPRDMVLAYVLWNLAAANGNADAAEQRARLIKRMTPAQVEEGQALSSAWKTGTALPAASRTGKE